MGDFERRSAEERDRAAARQRSVDDAAERERLALERANAPLVAFVYLLARDHLAFGVIEALVALIEGGEAERVFSDVHQAAWARSIMDRLT